MRSSTTDLDGFQPLADTLGDMVSRHALDGRYTYASSGARDLLGYEPEELLSHTGFEFVHPDDLADVGGAQAALLKGVDRVDLHYRYRHKDGSFVECETIVRGIYGSDSELAEIVAVRRPVRERLGGDMLRRQWELCFKRTSRGITVVESSTGTIVSLNPALAEMHGGTVGDFVGRPLVSLFTEASAAKIPDVSGTVDNNTFVSYDSEHVRIDGGVFPVHAEVMAARDALGSAQYRIAWYDDLTERRQAERRAGLAERDFETSFHASPHGVAIVGLDGRFVHVNQKLCEITGYPTDQLLDLTFQDITHPDDLDADLTQLDELLAGRLPSYEMEKRYFTKGGHLIWISLAVAIVREEDGSPRHFISQIQDISARKRLEAHTFELANRDQITSLFNRRRFEEELKRQIDHCRDADEDAALLLLDLDGFKNVNDSAGHVAGDRLIRLVGRAIDDRISDPDIAQAHQVAEELRLAIAGADSDHGCTPASASAASTATSPMPRTASAPSTARCTGRRAGPRPRGLRLDLRPAELSGTSVRPGPSGRGRDEQGTRPCRGDEPTNRCASLVRATFGQTADRGGGTLRSVRLAEDHRAEFRTVTEHSLDLRPRPRSSAGASKPERVRS